MLEISKVIEQFSLLSGLTSQETMQWLPLCTTSLQWVEDRIKPEANIAKAMDILTMLAAAICNYRYALLGGGVSTGESIKVGGISVSSSSASGKNPVDNARRLHEEYLTQAADYLLCDSASFLKAVGT